MKGSDKTWIQTMEAWENKHNIKEQYKKLACQTYYFNPKLAFKTWMRSFSIEEPKPTLFDSWLTHMTTIYIFIYLMRIDIRMSRCTARHQRKQNNRRSCKGISFLIGKLCFTRSKSYNKVYLCTCERVPLKVNNRTVLLHSLNHTLS